MKKLLLSGLCAMLSAAANAQNVMVVEQKSGTATEFNVDDIQRVYFKNNGGTDVNPSNAVLSSRLKDKNGNPVLLERIKLADDEEIKYNYDSDGLLVSYEEILLFSINSNTISVTNKPYSGTFNYTLNENGLISDLTVEQKGPNDIGTTTSKYACHYNYNDEMQLISFDIVSGQTESYDADGILIEKTEIAPQFPHAIYNWENGNLVSRTYLDKHWTDTWKYGTDLNINKQPSMGGVWIFEDRTGLLPLQMLGLFGVGSANFRIGDNPTINPNGTIASEDNAVYIYK